MTSDTQILSTLDVAVALAGEYAKAWHRSDFDATETIHEIIDNLVGWTERGRKHLPLSVVQTMRGVAQESTNLDEALILA